MPAFTQSRNPLKFSFYLYILAVISTFTGCNTGAKLLKEGDNEFRSANYFPAIEKYKLAQEKLTKDPNIPFKIAESFRLANKIFDSETYYQDADARGCKMNSLPFYYGMSLKTNGKYDEAAQQFKNYVSQADDPDLKSAAAFEIANLNEIKKLAEKNTRNKIKNFSAINTSASEFCPVLIKTGLIFSSSRGENNPTFLTDGSKFTDLYRVTIENDGNVSNPEPVGSPINTPNAHEATTAISLDGKTMLFTRSNTGIKDDGVETNIYETKLEFEEWTAPAKLAINGDTTWESSPAFSLDNNTLYFSSNREGGFGGLDLYKATKVNGEWGNVQNLGSTINTSGNEVFPVFGHDGTLYFSSDRHVGLGNLDIFYSKPDGNTFSKPLNMGPPINSPFDDFHLVMDELETKGYFSSNRAGGSGDDDIYEVELVPLTFGVDGLVFEVLPETKDTVPVTSARVRLIKEATQIDEFITKEDGKFSFELSQESDFEIIGTKTAYFTKTQTVTTKGLTQSTKILVKILLELEKIDTTKYYKVDNIYYDYDKADIRVDAAAQLERVDNKNPGLIQILKENPGISIELHSHTDSRGTDEYNNDLSQRRAESAVNFISLIKIDKKRMKPKGFGESKPLIPNAETAIEHQINRRTEFKVFAIDPTKEYQYEGPTGQSSDAPKKQEPAKNEKTQLTKPEPVVPPQKQVSLIEKKPVEPIKTTPLSPTKTAKKDSVSKKPVLVSPTQTQPAPITPAPVEKTNPTPAPANAITPPVTPPAKTPEPVQTEPAPTPVPMSPQDTTETEIKDEEIKSETTPPDPTAPVTTEKSDTVKPIKIEKPVTTPTEPDTTKKKDDSDDDW